MTSVKYTRFIYVLSLPCFLFIILGLQGGTVTGAETYYANCFEFTWLGPQFTNESSVNGTCEDMDPKSPICVDPLVYTADGSKPNTTAMWIDPDIQKKVGCRLSSNEVCAKWTYIFNGGVENITHLCTKIIIDGRSAMTNGCQTQFKDGYTIEVCACKSSMGPEGSTIIPCNGNTGAQIIPPILLIIICILYSII